MHACYEDILSRIAEAPKWWDENAVPRYCDFSPSEVANIYADQACLALIQCQACHTPFKVAFSWYRLSGVSSLRDDIENDRLHYADPPNQPCCDMGPSMTSETLRVLEYHEQVDFNWRRLSELEVELSPY